MRKRLLEILGNYWWVLLIGAGIGYFFTDIPVFQYLMLAIGILFALLIFMPFVVTLFGPLFVLIGGLLEPFKEAQDLSFSKKFVFMPMSFVGVTTFAFTQVLLSIWIVIISFLAWEALIGPFLTILGFFFFGLAPVGIVSAPFILWWKEGLSAFFYAGSWILMAFLWTLISKLAWSEDYLLTPDDFLGYSPHTFVVGALSLQVLAYFAYMFDLFTLGIWISDLGGWIFLILAIISGIQWHRLKRRLSKEERHMLYKPSVWMYILGFLMTNGLSSDIGEFQVSSAVLLWLNTYFVIVLIWRLIAQIVRRIRRSD